MSGFILWLLLMQALTGAHDMDSGTVVTLAAPDLVPVYSSAKVEGNRLVFETSLEPETDVRVLIILPGTSADSAEAHYGRIGPTGDDIIVQFEGVSQAVSLRKWLAEEYDIELIFSGPGE